MQDVLHSKRIRIDKKVEYRGYCSYTMLKIYYDNELVYNFPDEFEGSIDEVCLRGRYTVIDGASQISDTSIIQEALEEYMTTPRRLLLDLPKGPYGLYEVLLAADERISYKTVETFQLWFKSRNGLRVAQLRLKNRKDKRENQKK